MKNTVLGIMVFGMLITLFNCQKEETSAGYLHLLDHISALQYYPEDPFANNYSYLNGVWEVIGTSGGFHGGGYPPDFDYLLIKPNAIFGIVRNDSLLAAGQIEFTVDPVYELLVKFVPEEAVAASWFEIVGNEKFIRFESDTLYLNGPCCDQFDTHLKKVE